MTPETSQEPIEFTFQGRRLTARLARTDVVVPGVTCDTRKFDETNSIDLGTIHLEATPEGTCTPVQEVMLGENWEGYEPKPGNGRGRLVVRRKGGRWDPPYEVNEEMESFEPVRLEVGDVMQWQAAPGSELHPFEVCKPPFSPDEERFRTLEGRLEPPTTS